MVRLAVSRLLMSAMLAAAVVWPPAVSTAMEVVPWDATFAGGVDGGQILGAGPFGSGALEVGEDRFWFSSFDDVTDSVTVRAFDLDGVPDTGFGTSGSITISPARRFDEIKAYPDGRLLFATWVTSFPDDPGADDTPPGFLVKRFLPDGSPDEFEGGNTEAVLRLAGGTRGSVYPLDDGGFLLSSGTRLGRYSAASEGVVAPVEVAGRIAVAADRQSVYVSSADRGTQRVQVRQFSLDLSLLREFSPVVAPSDGGGSLLTLNDGRVVVTSIDDGFEGGLVVFNVDGSVDSDQSRLIDRGELVVARRGNGFVLQDQVPLGTAELVAYGPDGQIDPTFGVDGRIKISGGGFVDDVSALDGGEALVRIVNPGIDDVASAIRHYTASGSVGPTIPALAEDEPAITDVVRAVAMSRDGTTLRVGLGDVLGERLLSGRAATFSETYSSLVSGSPGIVDAATGLTSGANAVVLAAGEDVVGVAASLQGKSAPDLVSGGVVLTNRARVEISDSGRQIAFSGFAETDESNVFVFDYDLGGAQDGEVLPEPIAVTSDLRDPATLEPYFGRDSYDADVSGNGDWVAFVSEADLDGTEEPGDTDPDIFVRSVFTLAPPIRVSRTPDGAPAASATGPLRQYSPVLSDSGRFVAFVSNATLLDDSENEHDAVFLLDRNANGSAVFDEPGQTTMQRVTADQITEVFSLDIDAGASTVSVIQTVDGETPTWVTHRRRSLTSSFDETAPRRRVLTGDGALDTNVSKNGRDVMVNDNGRVYVTTLPFTESRFPDVSFPSDAWKDGPLFRPVVSDPVNTATGALVASVTDLPAPSGAPMLELSRTYDSQRSGSPSLSSGWRSNWDATIDVRRGGPVFVDNAGAEYFFAPSSSGTGFVRPSEVLAELAEAAAGGWTLSWFSGETWAFDAAGQLAKVTAWDEIGVAVERDDAGAVTGLQATTGHRVDIVNSDTGYGSQMISAIMSDGRTATYGYAEGRLTSVVNPTGAMSYSHDDSGRIVSEIDSTGVVTHESAYDLGGRVVQQRLPHGERTRFTYNDELRTTTVTDVESGDVVVYSFDSLGRLTSITDPEGNVSLSEWSDDGLPTGSTDRLGHNPSAVYDANSNLTSLTGPVRGTTTYTYDAENRVTSVTEPTGAVTSMSYEGDERIPSTVTDALGNSTTFTIDDGLVSEVVDADGVSTFYVYDGQRRMVEMTNGLGFSWSYEYDAVGRQTGSTTPLGFVTARTFDDAGRMLTSTAADGGVTSYVYDADGRVLSTTDPVGAVVSNSYDPVTGLLASTTDPAGRVTVYTYNELSELVAVEANDGGVSETDFGTLGRVTATRDPLGRETTYAYDANGNRTEVVAPDGGVTRTEFDTAGRIAALEDPIGRRTTHAYDEFGRLVSVTQPDGTQMSYTYDLLGRQVETIAPDGGVTATAFTPAGRTGSVTDPEAGVTTYSYDVAGQMDSVTDPNGFATGFEYDPDGRRTAVITPEGLVTNWEYDPLGRISKIIDPAGIELARTYTLRGELATEQREGDGVVSYVYNPDGTMASVADALGNTTTFTYDAAGRQETRVDVTGAVEVMEYNTAGELVGQVDRLGQRTEIAYDTNGRIATVADPSGRTTSHAYDVAGQLLDRTFGDGTTIGYEYDDLGRRTQMVDPTGVTTYAYDDNGRPVEVAAPNGTLGYSYDLAGRRTGLTYPDGTTVTYDYDPAGRLVGLTDPNTGDVDYTLDDDGRLVLTELPNGETRSFGFVNGQMVTYQDHGRVTDLTYDESGRIATLAGAQNHTYTYDQAGQLREAVQDEGTYAYSYGSRGEITSITDPDRTRTFTHNANVEIDTVADGDGETGNVVYDQAGRMVEHNDPDGTVTTYVYDARGLLVETTITTPGDGNGGGGDSEPDPCVGLTPTIVGTDGDDVIQGTWQDDIIFGLGGNDTITGASGADIICGGDGDDTISGQSQDDTIYGGAGNDTITGDSGADTIDGGSGDDVLEGNSQDDTIQGGSGDDEINGGSDSDALDGGNGNDVVDGSWQTDSCDDAEQAINCETVTFNGETNDDPSEGPGAPILCNGLVATIVGTPGDDIINGTWQDDVIVGYGGNDTINGQSGADTICGGDGDDIISGQSQDDVIFGEAGNDTISGDSGADIIDGGPGDDTITGDSQNDTIQGGDGDDNINGGPGNDSLDGGNDTDTLDGSWGTDTCDDAETVLGCESVTMAGEATGDDGTSPPDPNPPADLTTESTGFVYDGDANIIAADLHEGLSPTDFVWDHINLASKRISTASSDGVSNSVHGYGIQMDGSTALERSVLGDVLLPGGVQSIGSAGPFGAAGGAEQVEYGYRGETEVGGLVYLRDRFLASDLGVFLTPDGFDLDIGSAPVANSYHYARNEPVASRDPLGTRTVDGGLSTIRFDEPCKFRGSCATQLIWSSSGVLLDYSVESFYNPRAGRSVQQLGRDWNLANGSTSDLRIYDAFQECMRSNSEFACPDFVLLDSGLEPGSNQNEDLRQHLCAEVFRCGGSANQTSLWEDAEMVMIVGGVSKLVYSGVRRGFGAAVRGLLSRSATSGSALAETSAGVYRSRAGLIYLPESAQGHRTTHVLDHLRPNFNPNKTAPHSVFVTSGKDLPSKADELFNLIDEAWLKRGLPEPGDPAAFVVPMGKAVGTNGERSIRLIVRPGTREVISAYPWP